MFGSASSALLEHMHGCSIHSQKHQRKGEMNCCDICLLWTSLANLSQCASSEMASLMEATVEMSYLCFIHLIQFCSNVGFLPLCGNRLWRYWVRKGISPSSKCFCIWDFCFLSALQIPDISQKWGGRRVCGRTKGPLLPTWLRHHSSQPYSQVDSCAGLKHPQKFWVQVWV